MELDKIIDCLADNKYHTVYELVEKTGLSSRLVGMISNMLLNYGFAMRAGGYAFRIKLTPSLQKFWSKIKWIERSENKR